MRDYYKRKSTTDPPMMLELADIEHDKSLYATYPCFKAGRVRRSSGSDMDEHRLTMIRHLRHLHERLVSKIESLSAHESSMCLFNATRQQKARHLC